MARTKQTARITPNRVLETVQQAIRARTPATGGPKDFLNFQKLQNFQNALHFIRYTSMLHKKDTRDKKAAIKDFVRCYPEQSKEYFLKKNMEANDDDLECVILSDLEKNWKQQSLREAFKQKKKVKSQIKQTSGISALLSSIKKNESGSTILHVKI